MLPPQFRGKVAGALQAACQEHREGLHAQRASDKQAFRARVEVAQLRAARLLARIKGYEIIHAAREHHGVESGQTRSNATAQTQDLLEAQDLLGALRRIGDEPNRIPKGLSPAEVRALEVVHVQHLAAQLKARIPGASAATVPTPIRVGDAMIVDKEGSSKNGQHVMVVDTAWNGMVKVELDGATKSYLETDLKPVPEGFAAEAPMEEIKSTKSTPLSESQTRRIEAIRKALGCVELLRGLDEEGLVSVASAMRVERVQTGSKIITQGEMGEKFYVLERGEVVVDVQNVGEVNRIQQGGFFGEMSLISNEPRSASVCALCACTLLTLNKKNFDRVMAPLWPKIMLESSRRMSKMKEQVQRLVGMESLWDGKLETAEEQLSEATARALAGDPNAIFDADRWHRLVDTHPEHIKRQAEMLESWHAANGDALQNAVEQVCSIIPEDIKSVTRGDLLDRGLTETVMKRVWNERSLWLVRFDPEEISRIHIAELRHKYTAHRLDITELRAVYASLPKEFCSDPGNLKLEWREKLFSLLKERTIAEENGTLTAAQLRHPAYSEAIIDWDDVDEDQTNAPVDTLGSTAIHSIEEVLQLGDQKVRSIKEPAL